MDNIKKRYDNIDGLRMISCIGIIAMHIRANTNFKINGWIFDTFIPSLTWLVYLLIIISGFAMCAGYLDKFKTGKVDLEQFYKRRYLKILPYFLFLILISLIIEPSMQNLAEGFIEATLLFGFLPNNSLDVLGVSWTLGVIFLFYLLFPFYSVILKNKRRAWISFIIALIINILCENYFFSSRFVVDNFAPRHSFIYCLPLFIMGGLIYLYRIKIEKFIKKNRMVMSLLCFIITILFYFTPDKLYAYNLIFLKSILLYSIWLSYSIGVNSYFLNNKITKYFSSISLEMYLSHMLIFRVVEKINLLYVFGNGWFQFGFVFLLTILGLIIFIKIFYVFEKKLIRYKNLKKGGML